MKNLMSVKELKEMLAKYNDDDVLMIEGGEGCDGDWAQMGIAKEEVETFGIKEYRYWKIEEVIFEMDQCERSFAPTRVALQRTKVVKSWTGAHFSALKRESEKYLVVYKKMY